MPDHDPLLPFLRAWEKARDQGRDPSADELCRDRPDLAPRLAARLAELRADSPPATSGPLGTLQQGPAGDPPPPPPAPPGRFPDRIGDYRLIDLLGQGGMGAVFRAEDVRLGRQVALKLVLPAFAADPKTKARFLREARAQANIDHDNITPIYQVGEQDGVLFIAMPLLRGESLRSRLRREPRLPLAVTLKIAGELAEGLAAAHAKEVIHRDIKPGNVWLEGDLAAADPAARLRRCRILDFGLARAADDPSAVVTGTGEVLGTPAYMSPEQARGGRVDERTDLFALGVMMYEMATGKQPFGESSAVAAIVNVVTVTPPPALTVNPHLPPALSDLIERMMVKDPDQRVRSARDVADALRRLEADLYPSDEPATWPSAPSARPGAAPAGGSRQAYQATPWMPPPPDLSDSRNRGTVPPPGPDGGEDSEPVPAEPSGGGRSEPETRPNSWRIGTPIVRRPGPPADGPKRRTPIIAGGVFVLLAAAGVTYYLSRPAVPPPGPEPVPVTVTITSSPPGAVVAPAAAGAGPPADARTPATYPAKPDRHEVVVRLDGYEPKLLTIDPRERREYHVELTPVPKPVPAVTVRVNVPAATVRAAGPTPVPAAAGAAPGEFVFRPAPAPAFRVRVEAAGYEPADVAVDTATATEYPVALVPATMRVVLRPFPPGTVAEFPDDPAARPAATAAGEFVTRRTPQTVRVRAAGFREAVVRVPVPPPGSDRVEVDVPLAPLPPPPAYTDSIGIGLRLVPAGSFEMAVGKNDPHSGAGPRVVELTKPFYLGRTEVTRGQYRRFVEESRYVTDAERPAGDGGQGYDPARREGYRTDRQFTWRNPGFPQTDDHPVVNVSWDDAKAFCDWLGRKEGRVYRLPTEAEWEYAARAGADGLLPFPSAAAEAVRHANVADAALRRRFLADNPAAKLPTGFAFEADDGFAFTAPVASFRANGYGLYDTYGNALEWCQDWYGPATELPTRDPVQARANPDGLRVARGGSFFRSFTVGELTARYRFKGTSGNMQTGFRVCVEPLRPAPAGE